MCNVFQKSAMLHSGQGAKHNCAAVVVQCSWHSDCYICGVVLAPIMGPFKVLLHITVGKQRRTLTKGSLERNT